MKKKFLAILVPTLSLLLASCSKDQLDTFAMVAAQIQRSNAFVEIYKKITSCKIGNSEANEIAKRLDGEVISADSMQIYKGMDI